jgi:hypothetical protein
MPGVGPAPGLRLRRLSQTAWARKVPEAPTTLTASRTIGHMGPPRSIGSRGAPDGVSSPLGRGADATADGCFRR